MIGKLPLSLPLPLPLLLTVTVTVTASLAVYTKSAKQNGSHCDILNLKDDRVEVEEERWVSVEGARRTVVVEWSGAAEGAAGALLASALRLAGYRGTRLRRNTLPLEPRSYLPLDRSEVVVVVAARWKPGDVWSGWLQAVGTPPAPVQPRLHRRLQAHSDNCTSTTRSLTKLYIVDEWERFINRTQLKESIVYVDRRELLRRIRSDDSEPFTFLDVEVWSEEPNVEVVAGPLPEALASLTARALRVADGAIWRHSPGLWHLLSLFEPSRATLRRLLTADRREDPMLAVCEEAALSPPLLDQLHTWAEYSIRYTHYAFVFLCTGDGGGDGGNGGGGGGGGGGGPEYDYKNETIVEYIDLLKRFENRLDFVLEIKVVNCDDDVAKTINALMQTEKFYRTIGVIGPGRIFGDVAKNAESNRLTLMSYTTVGHRTVGTVGGRPGTIVRALRDLLAACGWRRLAVLSGRDHAATELSAALGLANDLNLKFVSLTSDRTAIRDILKTLKRSEARVFLVNAEGGVARRVVRAATELGMTARAGHVWLVREWLGPGAGADRLDPPYEVTLAWRGGDDRSPLWPDLKDRWTRRGSWPLYAAPLADAVLALGKRYMDIFHYHPSSYDDVHSEDTFRHFWNLTETRAISQGVGQELRFKDRELKSPRAFLYRWNRTRATLVGEWRVGGGGATCPLQASDGSRDCVVPVGDRFEQHCGDKWVIAGVLALTALVPVLVAAAVVAAKAARRALRARDAHLVKRAEEMLEARWRAKASRLEPYFVDPSALKLLDLIGAGRFGRVWLGILRDPRGGGAVAAKALREDAAPVEETEFFREARALAALQHVNVVRFVGVCVTEGPPLLLMEYAFFGDLLRYLRARRHLAASDSPEAAQVSAEALTRFARQAATALAYLARRGYVHRDVRAANCLVDERRDLKLADFGMARATTGPPDGDGEHEYTSRRRALFPVLWMAPESLSRGVFSAASDVWALGVLALELVTLGARPYGALSPMRVHHFVVREGRRPPLPRELGGEAREALLACWRRAPADRPTAAVLAAWLARRPRALAPTPRAAPPDDRADDVDSGIGEPRPPFTSTDHVALDVDDLSLS